MDIERINYEIFKGYRKVKGGGNSLMKVNVSKTKVTVFKKDEAGHIIMGEEKLGQVKDTWGLLY